MNKEKFLSELREYLSILENQEQEDILEEYAQHIDMKMQKGLSEEEAIRDFGSVGELAAEILEAYHVNPDFRKRNTAFRFPKPKAGVMPKADPMPGTPGVSNAKSQKPVWEQIWGYVRKALAGAAHRIGSGIRWIGGKCRAFAGWVKKPFTGRKSEFGGDAEENRMEMEGTKEMGGRMGKFFRTVGSGIAALWRWFVRFCIFWLKFMWNAAWLLFAMFCACLAMITLMGVGAASVLLAQGYPLIGVFIICIGGLLCMGSLSYGAFSMLVRSKQNDGDGNNAEEEKSGKEVVYEQTT